MLVIICNNFVVRKRKWYQKYKGKSNVHSFEKGMINQCKCEKADPN